MTADVDPILEHAELGFWMHSTRPRRHPRCQADAVVDIFEHALRWRCCGEVISLPPIHHTEWQVCPACLARRAQIRERTAVAA